MVTQAPVSLRTTRFWYPARAGTGSRKLHDRIVTKLPRSPLIVTEDYREDFWLLKSDPRRSDKIGMKLRFDAVVAPGAVRLNSAGRELDLTAAKVRAVLAGLLGTGWCTTGETLRGDYRSHLQFIRWRLASGFPTVASLTPDAFDLFCSDLCGEGRRGIVPTARWLAEYLAKIDAGRLALPLAKHRLGRPNWKEIAHQVGSTTPKRSRQMRGH